MVDIVGSRCYSRTVAGTEDIDEGAGHTAEQAKSSYEGCWQSMASVAAAVKRIAAAMQTPFEVCSLASLDADC